MTLVFSSVVVSAKSTSRTLQLIGNGTAVNTEYVSLNSGSATCKAKYSAKVNPHTAKHTISATVYLRRWRWYGYDNMGSMPGVSNFSVSNTTDETKTVTANTNTVIMYSLITNGSYYFAATFTGSSSAYCNTIKVTISQ